MAITEGAQVAAEDFEAWIAALVEGSQVASEDFEHWTGKNKLRYVRARRDRIPGDIQP